MRKRLILDAWLGPEAASADGYMWCVARFGTICTI